MKQNLISISTEVLDEAKAMVGNPPSIKRINWELLGQAIGSQYPVSKMTPSEFRSLAVSGAAACMAAADAIDVGAVLV